MSLSACFRTLLAFALLATTRPASAQAPALPSPRIKVYVVGTFHFNASETDVNHGTKVDMSTPEKQRELEELTGKLQKTHADKVFVEQQLSQQPHVDSAYALYRKNQLKPRNNEVYQLGYRLANKLNLKRVLCADAPASMDYEAAQTYAKQHGQEPILNGYFEPQPGDSVGLLIKKRLEPAKNARVLDSNAKLNESLLAHLIRINAEADYQTNMDGYLLTLARVGGADSYAGADLAGDFFKRNVRIYGNILRQVDVQHDKAIVLIIGNGHVAFLKSILRYNSLFEVMEVAPLLEAK